MADAVGQSDCCERLERPLASLRARYTGVRERQLDVRQRTSPRELVELVSHQPAPPAAAPPPGRPPPPKAPPPAPNPPGLAPVPPSVPLDDIVPVVAGVSGGRLVLITTWSPALSPLTICVRLLPR